MATKFENRKGVQKIHLFNKIWRIGRLNYMKTTNRPHCVIYSPDDKEYHVYDNEALNLRSVSYDFDDSEIIIAERSDLSKVKIYILSNILDDVKNWCDDLDIKPELGKTVKIIYNNGTIKNIKFNGKWEVFLNPKSYFSNNGEKIVFDKKIFKKISPVMWRKN